MKVSRHAKIIELISQYDIETQEELAEYLNNAGFKVTQATVSRDIRDLKLTKLSVNGGRQKYIVHRQEDDGMNEKYIRVLPHFKRRFCIHGYGTEYPCDQNSCRNGNGGCCCSRCNEME